MADTEALVSKLNEFAANGDFEGAFKLIRENKAEFSKKLHTVGVKDALKKTTNDRLLLSFLDGVDFARLDLDTALVQLEKLVSFQLGSLVLSKAWGLGVVKKLDYFYKRITVDFKVKKGHQFSYAAAVDMLESAPMDHILVLRQSDPTAFEALLKKPAEFVKAVIKSFGEMPIVRLEDVCSANGFVKSVNWKKFWDEARAELRKDKLVEIPVKRTDPIRIKAAAEDYGDSWITAFSHETDPKLILSGVREYVDTGKFKTADADTKDKIGDRLAFAVTAARNVDDALYARLASEVTSLGYANPGAEEMRAYLWERKRYVKAAAQLPSRNVGEMIAFLATDDNAKAKLYASIPEFCYTAVTEVVGQFGSEEACRKAVGDLMKQPKAPATLTTLIVGKYSSFKSWTELPPLITLLTHAIALGEGRQGGETLKMQNLVRRLFGTTQWLAEMFGALSAADQALFFERFQASIAWDPATHHTTVIRMTHIVPALESRIVKLEKKKEYARITSPRSYAAKKAEYLKLINEEMPENIRKIEFAKGFGDLSENAEYQYAKDEQRALMQKQTLMQADLEAVKEGDFSDATTDEVMPGVTVKVDAEGVEKIYTILGEWDNDLEKGILSSKTRVAQNLMGKKVGESFDLPKAEGGSTLAIVKEILPLSEEIREWIKG